MNRFEEIEVKNTAGVHTLVKVQLHLSPSQIISVSREWWEQNKMRLKGILSDTW